MQGKTAGTGTGVEAWVVTELCAVWPSEHSSLSVPVSPLPPPPSPELIRLLAVILLVGVPIMSVFVLLREVCLRAQSRERQQAGARADCRE